MDIAIVSEIHPWQLIEQAVRDKYDPSVEAKLLHQFSTMAVHHAAVTDSLFWSSAYAEIASANGAGKYRQHEIQRLRELSVAKLEIARKILAEQYGILQFGNFSTLYNEDKNVDPIKINQRSLA